MPVPMIDDIELKAVQVIRQETDQDFVRQKIAGLPGTLHQRLGRRSHRVLLSGALLPDTAAGDLEKLQGKAAAGDEVTFTADITTALTIDKMVIEAFRAEQQVGPAGQITYSQPSRSGQAPADRVVVRSAKANRPSLAAGRPPRTPRLRQHLKRGRRWLTIS